MQSSPQSVNGMAGIVLQRYPTGKLYEVIQNVNCTQPMDLQLARGHVVAVIKEQDPTGNKERYFVDNGG